MGVAKGHPAFELGYDDVPAPEPGEYLNVHGGLTYSNKCVKNRSQGETVCHVVEKGEDDNIWWLGFDCAHCGDYSSMSYTESMRRDFPRGDAVYRTIDYVKTECKHLAKQLKKLES